MEKESNYSVIDSESLETVGTVYATEKAIRRMIKSHSMLYERLFLILASLGIVSFAGLAFIIGRTSTTGEIREQQAIIDTLSIELEMLAIQNDELMNFCLNEKMNVAIGKYLRVKKASEPTVDSIYAILDEVDAWYPDYIVAQAILESATFTSNVYKSNNNLFGMKMVSKRSTTQTGKQTDNPVYGHYKNWQLCVLDRVLWDMHRFKEKPSLEEYEKSLMQYAEDSEYVVKLKNIIKSNGKL